MAHASFRTEQEAGRYADHVRPINKLVDELSDSERGWMPHVAPAHGGVNARVLTILRDPGPMTRTGTGSGFLCVENDDQTAQTQMELMAMPASRPATSLRGTPTPGTSTLRRRRPSSTPGWSHYDA